MTTVCQYNDYSELLKKVDGEVYAFLEGMRKATGLSPVLLKDAYEELIKDFNKTLPLDQTAKAIIEVAEDYELFDDPLFPKKSDILGILEESDDLYRPSNEDNSTTKIEDPARIALGKDVKKDFLVKAYGTAVSTRLKVEKEASIALVNALLINREDGKTVSSVEDMNLNIRNYQQKLFDIVVNFLKTEKTGLRKIDPEKLKDTTMYKPDGRGNWIYTGIVNDLDEEISAILNHASFGTDDKIDEGMNYDPTNTDEHAKNLHERVLAYNAWTLLTHFDSLMKLKYGDALEIYSFGDMVFTGQDKYKRAERGANNTKTWRTTEEINLNSEIDNSIQELINSTPLLRYGDSSSQLGYLQFNEFSDMIAKIKESSYFVNNRNFVFSNKIKIDRKGLDEILSPLTWNAVQGLTFTQVINRIRKNPQRYLSAVFEVLSHPVLYDYIKDTGILSNLKDSDKNIIYSIHMGLTGNTGVNSVNAISSRDPKSYIYEELSQVADSIFRINFLQYYRGQNGQIQVRNMLNTRMDGILRNIRQTIKTKNSSKLPGVYISGENHSGNVRGISLKGTFNKTDKSEDFKSLKIEFPNSDIYLTVSKDGEIKYYKRGDKQDSEIEEININTTDGIELLNGINNVLGLNISRDTIRYMSNSDSEVNTNFKSLVNLTGRTLLNIFISNDILKGIDAKTKMQDCLNAQLGQENSPKIDINMGEIDIIPKKDINTLEMIAKAVSIEQGLLSSSQIKSGSGNSQSQQSLSRLLGSVQSQFELQNKTQNSASRNMFLLQNGVIKGIYTAREFYDLNQVQDHTKFNVNEFTSAMFLQDYISGLIPRKSFSSIVGDGVFAILPSVNSDKNTVGRLVIDGNREVIIGGQTKALKDLTAGELEGFINTEFKRFYDNVINKINKDINTILSTTTESLKYTQESFDKFNERHIRRDSEGNIMYKNGKPLYDSARALNAFIKNYNLQHPHAPLSITDQMHFITNKDGSIKPNKVLLEYHKRFNIPELSSDFFKHKKADVIGSLLRCDFKVDLTDNSPESLYIKDYFTNEAKSSHDPRWIDNTLGEMVLGYVTVNGVPHRILNKSDLIPVKNNLLEALKGRRDHVDNEILNIYNYLMDRLTNADLLYDPQVIPDVIDFLDSDAYKFELNPLIDKYNYLDYLISQEWMDLTVGTLCNHPVKKDDGNVEHEEAGRFQAQHKRNVSMTAAMQEFALGLLNGIPSDYNIAVIDDVKDIQYNVSGDIDDGVKPFDGATFVNPFIVYLENESLGAAKAGISKKQFVHFYDESTGSGGIIKTAGFGLTNDWMRNSPFLEKMMWKMTQQTWFDVNGNPIVLDITKKYSTRDTFTLPYIVKKNGTFYSVNNIIPTEEPNRYRIEGTPINIDTDGKLYTYESENGDDITDLFITDENERGKGFLVNSNYTLWQLFGGLDSYEQKGAKFIPSENSIKSVVAAMNSIWTKADGTPLSQEEIENARTQDDVYQPLKHSDIHYMPTAGAVKQGAANINTNSLYYDNEPLNFMKIHMYQAGIQLDKEHHADGSELSLMTQVVNACAHRGFSLDDSMEMFKALRTLTDVGTADLLNPIKEVFGNKDLDPKDRQRIVVEAAVNVVVKALSKQTMSESDLLSVFAQELIEEVKKGRTLTEQDYLDKLPRDNPAVYAKFISTISVFLTNSGIKMKIPGILSVLTPSYNIMQLYQVPDGNGGFRTVKFEEIRKRAEEQGKTPQEYLQSLQNDFAPQVLETRNVNGMSARTVTLKNLKIGRSYFIDGSEESIKITDPYVYKKLKNEIVNGQHISIVEDITKGRELANYDVHFTGKIANSGSDIESDFTLWDLDSIQALFELKDTSDIDTFKVKYAYLFNEDISKLDKKQLETLLRRVVRKDTLILSPQTEEFVKKEEGEEYSVLIDGHAVVVNKTSIQTEPYELILPKIFIDEFNLDTYDSLDDIKNDPNFFTKKLIKDVAPTISDDLYTFALLNGSKNKYTGKLNHYYITSSEPLLQQHGLRKIEINKIQENGKLYRTDLDGNHIYELSSDKDKIYVDNVGNEIIVTENEQFYIDHLNYITAKISENEFDETTVAMFENSKNKSAKKFYKFLTENNVDAFDRGVSETEASEANLEEMRKMNALLEERHGIDVYSDHPLAKYFSKIGAEMHTSFLKSLEVVASRTPSQSMQSFMPMKIVAFDNPNINTAFVSTAQIWLQGSDYDIDAVSIAAYDIDNSGRLKLWSPYADITNMQNMNDSMRLPFPTGKPVEMIKRDSADPEVVKVHDSKAKTQYREIFAKFGALFDIRNGKTIHFILKEPTNLKLLAEFIKYVNKNGLYELSEQDNKNLAQGFVLDNPVTTTDGFRLDQAIADIVNLHNEYLNGLSQSALLAIGKNQSMYDMYKIIDTPANLIQAGSSVDAMTGPIKSLTKNFKVSKLIDERTPGNFVNKAESIEDNQVGKDGISICAVGMKSYFGTTTYQNYIINYGTDKQKQRLKLGFYDSRGKYNPVTMYIPGLGYKRFEYWSNLNPMLQAGFSEAELAKIDNDTDAALILSALLSLATDNAKELQLSKLNAGIKTLGMYVYGTSIGMDINSIVKLMTSDIGLLLNDLTKSNVFTNTKGVFSIDKVFDYLETGPKDLIAKYDENIFINNEPCESYVKVLSRRLFDAKDYKLLEKKLSPSLIMTKFAWSNVDLETKLKHLDDLKNSFSYISLTKKRIDKKAATEDLQRYNQLIEVLKEYVRQVDLIKDTNSENYKIYESLKTLYEGASEMKILGQLYGLNKGLVTKSEEVLQKVMGIADLVKDRQQIIDRKYYRKELNKAVRGNIEDFKYPEIKSPKPEKIDIVRFCFDKDYREEQIEAYDRVKHTINILDAVGSVPHFDGYLQSLAVAFETCRNTNKRFEETYKKGSELIESLGITSSKDKRYLFKGLSNYYSDYIRKSWMLDNPDRFILEIPKGIPTILGKKVSKDGGVIRLGTTEGDAAFKYLMENEIIPKLQSEGNMGSKERTSSRIKNNKFIKDLSTALLTNTITHNPIIYYTLPINMLPSTDEERNIFNMYKSEFNKLSTATYLLGDKEIPLIDLFYYYGLIAHYGKQGQQSLMPIFENFHDKDGLSLSEFHKYESSFNEEIPFEEDKLYPYILRNQSPYEATANKIYAHDPELMITEIWVKATKSKLQADIQYYMDFDGMDSDAAYHRVLSDNGAKNGYIKQVNDDLRNKDINNYFMSYDEIKNGITLVTYKMKLEDDTFTDITFDQQGNVFNIKGFNDLLSKYPKLKTMPKHTVDMKEDYNLDLYEQYLNQAISQEKGECGNN